MSDDELNVSVRQENLCSYDGSDGKCLYKQVRWNICEICIWRKKLNIPKLLIKGCKKNGKI
uniref:Uncharacterized protein n=1 Tax=viral metagenome TaxID=1070528 RepID=A0A6M3K790_9ZZZZ